jgi:hypothetical protein
MVLSDIIANLHQPSAILMLFIAAVCLAGYGYEGYRNRTRSGFLWIVFVVVGILAIIEWIILVFS